jgi:hypothetical protein
VQLIGKPALALTNPGESCHQGSAWLAASWGLAKPELLRYIGFARNEDKPSRSGTSRFFRRQYMLKLSI